ncbi:gamma subclass chorismate mutase AroQ [Chitinivorax sp. B]|uniref:gamma subclass chorismate mutase AroQ n=1 Tax=Chitinivorax sp. B TaxID=2502235 RepID=UPI0032D5A8D9
MLALMNERLKLMPDVARYKWNDQSPVEDLPREKIILDGLVKQAAEAKVAPELATTFFRAQIEAAKVIQRKLIDDWRQSQPGRFEDIPDLKTEIRPRLDDLTAKLIQALARNQATLADPTKRQIVATAAKRWVPASNWGDAAYTATQPLLTAR